MTIHAISRRELNQDLARAKRAVLDGPVAYQAVGTGAGGYLCSVSTGRPGGIRRECARGTGVRAIARKPGRSPGTISCDISLRIPAKMGSYSSALASVAGMRHHRHAQNSERNDVFCLLCWSSLDMRLAGTASCPV